MNFPFLTTIAPIPSEPIDRSEEKGTDSTLTYVCMTTPHLDRLKRNLPVVIPHVDQVFLVVGQRDPTTFEYLDSLKSKKVNYIYHPWEDSFAKQYSQYLSRVKYGWILLCDDDELPSEGMLNSLRPIIAQSENGTKYDCVEFRANDISYKENEWSNRHESGPCEYYRQMFFKYNPKLHYTVDLHQSLRGLRGPVIRCKEHYYHIKSTLVGHRNACRNYFIAGEWPPGPQADGIRTKEWVELKELLAKHHPEVKIFGDFDKILVAGLIHPDIEGWIRKYKDHNLGIEGESSGELRAYYNYYFTLLHPDKSLV